MATLQQGLTLEQFLELPEAKPALEYDDGRILRKVAPQGEHSTLQVRLANKINAFAIPARMAMAFTELRTVFGGKSYVPDLSVYTWDRIPRAASGRVANLFRLPPDIVVEIVSPKQSTNALVRRCLWYVQNGVRIALLLDAADDSVILFLPDRPAQSLRGDDSIDLTSVLPGFALTVQQVFDLLIIE